MTLRSSDERARRAGRASRGGGRRGTSTSPPTTASASSVRLACAPVARRRVVVDAPRACPTCRGRSSCATTRSRLPRQGLEVRADGLWGELSCETPFEHWTYGLEAFGVRLDDPADSLRGEIGERMPVGLDIEWEVDPAAGRAARARRRPPGRRVTSSSGSCTARCCWVDRDSSSTRAVAALAHVGRSATRPVGARGVGARVRARAELRGVGCGRDRRNGHDGRRPRGPRSLRSGARRTAGADGLPVAARHVVDDRLEIDADVLGLVTVPIVGPRRRTGACSLGACAATRSPEPTTPTPIAEAEMGGRAGSIPSRNYPWPDDWLRSTRPFRRRADGRARRDARDRRRRTRR